jgi:hypothetical protein
MYANFVPFLPNLPPAQLYEATPSVSVPSIPEIEFRERSILEKRENTTMLTDILTPDQKKTQKNSEDQATQISGLKKF